MIHAGRHALASAFSRFATAAGSTLRGPARANAVPRGGTSASGRCHRHSVQGAPRSVRHGPPSWLDGALLCAQTPRASPVRRPPCVDVGGPRRESGAEHRGPRFPSLEASRPDRALRRGAGFSAATCAHARGGAAGPRRVCWHARSRWRREGKGTAARRVFSGATPPGTCGRIFAFPGVWRGRGEQRPRR